MGGPSSLWLNNMTLRVCVSVCVCACMRVHHLCPWCVSGHLGCFHVLAVVNNVQWTWGCIYLLESLIWFPLDKYPVMELTDRMAVLFFLFEEPSYRFPQRLHQFAFLPTAHKGSLSHILPSTVSPVFDDGLSDRCEVVSHCAFDSCLPRWRVMLSCFSFLYLLVLCMSSLDNV